MDSELIFVGDALVMGKIVNTNGAFLSEKLYSLGLNPLYHTIVGNNKEQLKVVFDNAIERADLIIVCGGSGIARDDVTRETISECLNLEMVENDESKKILLEYFSANGKTVTEDDVRKTYIPKGAKVINNCNGVAQGIYISSKGKDIILLPGSPVELQVMFEDSVESILADCIKKTICENAAYSQTVKICGKSENDVISIISDLFEFDCNVSIKTFAKMSETHIIVNAIAENEKEAKKLVKTVIKDIKSRLGDAVYTTRDDVTLEQAVVDLLLANKLTVTTVESCTGGMVAARLINVPGVSEVFKMGHITYSNKSKRKLVGVKRGSLDKYGAVSSRVVKEMAKGAAALTRADVAVAISGIAGPDGGTSEKPVGLVYIGVSVCGEVTTEEFRFKGNREMIRQSAVTESLILMRKCIMAYYSQVEFNGR